MAHLNPDYAINNETMRYSPRSAAWLYRDAVPLSTSADIA
jgi:hypothetical protein